MSTAKHTKGPLTVRLTGTCSAAWAEIGQECVDPASKELRWRDLGSTETTHVERLGPHGKPLPGPVGSIDDQPARFELTEEGEEHIANAYLWAASPDLLVVAKEMYALMLRGDIALGARGGIWTLPDRLAAAIAKATMSA